MASRRSTAGFVRANPETRADAPDKSLPERAKDIALQEAYRLVPVREGDKIVKMPAFKRSTAARSRLRPRGTDRAAGRAADCAGDRERRSRPQHGASETAIEYKAEAEREAERRRRLGITYVDPTRAIQTTLTSTCTRARSPCATRILRQLLAEVVRDPAVGEVGVGHMHTCWCHPLCASSGAQRTGLIKSALRLRKRSFRFRPR